MNEATLKEPAKAILLDIEGTTTPIDFVYQTLFPYARRHARDYLARHLNGAAREDLSGLIAERAIDVEEGNDPPAIISDSPGTLPETAVEYICWLMDRDRKSTSLKSLQGKIWEEGYRTGELKSDLFEDVPRAFERWRSQHRRISIYSSGSELAQRLLFAHTSAGDLTRSIEGYFDTRIGAKREPESYRRIAEFLKLQPAEIVFISDVTAELKAARSAGVQPLLATRPGNPEQPSFELYPQAATFDAIFP